eukprot:4431261-Prymnesium_polylepis.5
MLRRTSASCMRACIAVRKAAQPRPPGSQASAFHVCSKSAVEITITHGGEPHSRSSQQFKQACYARRVDRGGHRCVQQAYQDLLNFVQRVDNFVDLEEV